MYIKRNPHFIPGHERRALECFSVILLFARTVTRASIDAAVLELLLRLFFFFSDSMFADWEQVCWILVPA